MTEMHEALDPGWMTWRVARRGWYQHSNIINTAYEVCPESVQPCNMKDRDIYWRRYKIQETLYIWQWHLSLLQIRILDLNSSPSCPQLPHCSFLNLISSVKSLPFQRCFSFGKSQMSQGNKSGLQGRWVTWVIWCFPPKKTLHQTWCMSKRVFVIKLPITSCPYAHSCGLLNYPNSFRGETFKLNAKLDAEDSLFYSLSHFECNSHTVHMLTQWHLLPPLTSTVKSPLITHVHSSPLFSLPSYINVVQTVLIILTMAGLFLDRPHTSESLLYHSVLMCAFAALFLMLQPAFGGVYFLDQLRNNEVILKDQIHHWQATLKLHIPDL